MGEGWKSKMQKTCQKKKKSESIDMVEKTLPAQAGQKIYPNVAKKMGKLLFLTGTPEASGTSVAKGSQYKCDGFTRGALALNTAGFCIVGGNCFYFQIFYY
jgi:hypothetical protein